MIRIIVFTALVLGYGVFLFILFSQITELNMPVMVFEGKIKTVEKVKIVREMVYVPMKEVGTIKIPSFKDLENFVKKDDTDKLEYVSKNDYFVCVDFADRFVRNFERAGYFSCVAYLFFKDKTAHAIVAVNTTDKGVVYVEPQNDMIIFPEKLRRGTNYCSLLNWDCSWIIKDVKSCFDNRKNPAEVRKR